MIEQQTSSTETNTWDPMGSMGMVQVRSTPQPGCNRH